MLQNQNLVSTLNPEELWTITEDMQKILRVVETYFTIQVDKNFIINIPVDDVFELKNFSHIKAFFNDIVSSAEIKATSAVSKNVPFSIIKLNIKVRTHSFAQDILQKKKSKIKEAMQKCSKGNQNEQQ